MTSPIATRVLLGIFPRGTDPPTTNPRATTPSVRSPTSSSLWAIFMAMAGAGAQGEGRVAARAHGGRGGKEQGRKARTGTLGGGHAA